MSSASVFQASLIISIDLHSLYLIISLGANKRIIGAIDSDDVMRI